MGLRTYLIQKSCILLFLSVADLMPLSPLSSLRLSSLFLSLSICSWASEIFCENWNFGRVLGGPLSNFVAQQQITSQNGWILGGPRSNFCFCGGPLSDFGRSTSGFHLTKCETRWVSFLAHMHAFWRKFFFRFFLQASYIYIAS